MKRAARRRTRGNATPSRTAGAELGDVMRFTSVSRHAMWWDDTGQCFEVIDDGPDTRRPECDFGTPTGDLIIDPWMQDAIGRSRKG